MKKIDKDELFSHLSVFLKKKGIELHDGAYTKQIQQGCRILADTVNLSQQALKQAKSAVGTRLERVRQVIHEKTASKAPSPTHAPAPPPSHEETSDAVSALKKPAAAKRRKARAKRKR
jgi:hypothetical protein